MSIFTATHEIDIEGRDVLVVTGEIDIVTAPDLVSAARTFLADVKHAPLLLDLAGVTFIDSLGIGTMVELRRLASRAHTPVVVVGQSHQVEQVFRVTGLAELFSRAEG